MAILNEVFENPKIKEFEHEGIIQAKDFSEEQKVAFIKAILYIISADNIITEEEKAYLSQLYTELETTNDILEKAIILSDEKMFEILESFTDKQEAYIIMCLNKAAYADQSLANEEEKLIEIFSNYMQSGKKPMAFYNKILTF